MATVTFHDKPALAALDGTEEFPLWQTSTASAKKATALVVKRLIVNASPVTAAGSDQSGATTLGNQEFHSVTTVAAGAGTKFPVLAAGLEGSHRLIRVAGSANLLLHYPPSGGKINDLAINEPIPIEPGTTAEFYSISTVNWITVP